MSDCSKADFIEEIPAFGVSVGRIVTVTPLLPNQREEVRAIIREELERLGLMVQQTMTVFRPLQVGDVVARGGILMTVEDAAKDTVTTLRFDEQGKVRREEYAKDGLRRMIYDPVPSR
jgi:hypothetical protein